MAVDRLRALTGLKPEFASRCVEENHGSFHAALASFAQSFPILMPAHFADAGVTAKNEDVINAELEVIYGAIRCVVDVAKCAEDVAWMTLAGTENWSAAAAIETITGTAAPASAQAPAKVPRPAQPSVAALLGSASSKRPATPEHAPVASETTTPAAQQIKKPGDSPVLSQPSPPSATAPATGLSPAVGADAKTAPKAAGFTFGKAPAPAGDAKEAPKATPVAIFGKAPTPAGNAKEAPKATAFAGFGKAPAPAGDAKEAPKATAFAGFGKAPAPAGGAVKEVGVTPAAPKAAPGVTFGAKVVTTGATAVNSAAIGNFGVAKAVKEDAPKVDLSTLPKLPADRYAGCFWDMPDFWKDEVEGKCALLTRNNGFLQRTTKEALRARLLKWVDVSKLYSAPVQYVKIANADEETTRVIIKDAVRTFFNETHRQKFHEFLYCMFLEFGIYGQAMSYVAGLCMLVLTEHETAMVLRKISKEYIPKHWAPEAVGFATNAWLIAEVMKIHQPDIHKHFDKLNFWPDTYMQKVISGLCVHCLDFDQNFIFLDNFMQMGFPWLVRFELALTEHFRDEILTCTPEQIGHLYEIMRMDSRAAESEDAMQIMQRALRMDLGDSLSNLDVMRMQVYTEKVEPRLAKAPKEEAFEPCSICETKRPKVWCETCELTLCTDCHDASAGGHKKDACKTEPY